MRRRERVYAYITHGTRLLVFTETDCPEAGLQVPAGTLEPGEDPRSGVLREAEEETGLSNLELLGLVGELECDSLSLAQIQGR